MSVLRDRKGVLPLAGSRRHGRDGRTVVGEIEEEGEEGRRRSSEAGSSAGCMHQRESFRDLFQVMRVG